MVVSIVIYTGEKLKQLRISSRCKWVGGSIFQEIKANENENHPTFLLFDAFSSNSNNSKGLEFSNLFRFFSGFKGGFSIVLDDLPKIINSPKLCHTHCCHTCSLKTYPHLMIQKFLFHNGRMTFWLTFFHSWLCSYAHLFGKQYFNVKVLKSSGERILWP